MIYLFLPLFLIPSTIYSMDYFCPPSISYRLLKAPDDEPVGGWITLEHDAFDGKFKAGQKVAPLTVLELPMNSSSSLVYDTYECFYSLMHKSHISQTDRKLIMTVGKHLKLLTPQETLILNNKEESNLTLDDAILCLNVPNLKTIALESIESIRSRACLQNSKLSNK